MQYCFQIWNILFSSSQQLWWLFCSFRSACPVFACRQQFWHL